MKDVGGAFTMLAIGVDNPFEIVTMALGVKVDGERSWPKRGDVSWQAVLP